MKTESFNYEPTIQAVGVFFAALAGFGLQRILEVDPVVAEIYDNRWGLFILASTLFLRFLVGSTNHLLIEHVHFPPSRSEHKLLTFDFTFIVINGLLITTMCYQRDLDRFLITAILILIVSALWVILNNFLRTLCRAKGCRNWWTWFFLDLLQAATVGGTWMLRSLNSDPILLWGLRVSIALLVPIFVASLMVDLFFQAQVIERISSESGI